MLDRRLTPWLTILFAALALAAIGGDNAPAQSRAEPALPEGALARLGSLSWRHPDTVSYVAYAADNTLLTGAADGVLRLWDRETGLEIRRYQTKMPATTNQVRVAGLGNMNAGRRVVNVALTEDGKIMATVLANNEIQLWNVRTGDELRKLQGPASGVASLAFSPDGKWLALRGGDRSVSIVKAGTGAEMSRIAAKPVNLGNGAVFIPGGTSGEASGMVFSRNGKVLATAEVELKNQKFVSYVVFSDVKTGNEIRRVETPDGTSAITYSPDRKRFAFASGNGVHLCNADDGAEIRQMKTPGATGALAFSPDGKILAAKGRDLVVRLFDADTGDKTRELGEAAVGNVNAVAFLAGVTTNETRDLAFSPDGQTLTVAAGPTLRFWNVSSGKEMPIAGGHRGAVTTSFLTSDGKTVLTHGVDRTLRRWDAATGKELAQFPEPRGTVATAFAPDGQTVALANADGTIRLHDCTDGKELHRLKGHQNGATGLAFSADSKTLASRGGIDRTVRLYDVAKGTELGTLTFQPSKQPGIVANPQGISGQALAFSRDGKTLAANANALQTMQNPNQQQPTTLNTSTLHVWDLATRTEIRQIVLPAGRAANHLVYSPDDRLLACENADQTVSLCEIASGKERALLGQPMAPVQTAKAQAAFVVVLGRGQVRPNRTSSSLGFTPDGGLLIARGPDNSVRVWDVDFAKEVAAFKGHAGSIQSAAIAANGRSLVSASSDTTALVWNLAPVKREPQAPAALLQPQAIEALWADLLGDDAGKANRSILTLVSGSNASVAFLAWQLKPAAPADAKKLASWIADLDSNSFQTRSKAIAELEKLGDLALPALHQALASNLPLETRRRIEPLIDKLTTRGLSAEQVRVVRAMHVLERIGTAEARALLETLAQGAPGALTTREAHAVLNNLAKLSTASNSK